MSRASRWQIFAAAPALLAIGAIVVIAIALGSRSPQPPAWYRLAADDAFDNGDYRTAAVCYERLLQAHPSDKTMALNLAQSLEATGQHDAAESLLTRLRATDHGQG